MRGHGSACAGALMLFANVALGAEPGFYFGASGGQAKYDFETPRVFGIILPTTGFIPPILGGVRPDPIFPFPTNPGAPVAFAGAAQPLVWFPADDDEATSWSLTAGYRAGRYFAFEVSYLNLGKLETARPLLLPGPPFGTGGTATLRRELETSGPALAAMGILPVTDSWDLFLRAGIFFADSELTTSLTGSEAAFGSSSTTFGSRATTLGAGAQFNWGEHWSARLEYQRFGEVGDEGDFSTDADVDVLSLGVLFRL